MVRVFYSQKTEDLIEKMTLTNWRQHVQQELGQEHQDMSDNWKMCAIGERIKIEGKDLESIKDLSPEAIRLGYEFSVAMQEKDNEKALEIITKIEQLPTIWRNQTNGSVKLFSEKNLVYIATIMKDGSPQVSPVWANYEDGYVLVNTVEGRIKHKNVLRDPRVAVSVVSKDNPLDMTTIRGVVEELIPDYDYKHADKLTQQYMGREHYPFKRDDEKRVILKIKPNKVFVLPELKMSE